MSTQRTPAHSPAQQGAGSPAPANAGGEAATGAGGGLRNRRVGAAGNGNDPYANSTEMGSLRGNGSLAGPRGGSTGGAHSNVRTPLTGDRHAHFAHGGDAPGVSWDPSAEGDAIVLAGSFEGATEHDIALAASFAAPRDVLHMAVDENGVPVPATAARMNTDDLVEAHNMQQQQQQTGGDDVIIDGENEQQQQDGTLTHAQGPAGAVSRAVTALSRYPPEVIRVARQLRGLDEQQFLMLADLTQKRAFSNVYSLLSYRGSSWYLPSLRPVEADETQCGVGYERTAGVWIALRGWRLEINVIGYVTRIVMLVALWLMLWSMMPEKHVELKGFVFDPVVAVLFSAITGGMISRLLRIPPLVCVLWMAILWHNVPSVGFFTSGIDKYVRKASTTFGLNLILIRAGLYIKPEELRPMLGPFLAFAFLPAIAELIAHSFTAGALFDYPDTTWSFTHGSMAAAVSPAVVVPAVLTLKLDGYGLTRGPSTLLMPAAPTEMVAGIWNINFMAQLAVEAGDTPLWLNILLGPLQIIGGAIVGVLLGGLHFLSLKAFLAEAKKLPHRQYTSEHTGRVAFLSTLLLILLGGSTLFFLRKSNLAGGGAIAVTVMGMTTSALMRRRGSAPYFAEQFRLICYNTADLWDTIVMPLLFAMVGTAINLSTVFTADFFPKALACLAVGVVARMVVTLLVTAPQDYSKGERAVMAVGWCGKATVQAALGRVVVERVLDNFAEIQEKKGVEVANRSLEYAQIIANQAVVLILVCAPIAALVMVRVGPMVMPKEVMAAVPQTEFDDETPKAPSKMPTAVAADNDDGDAVDAPASPLVASSGSKA